MAGNRAESVAEALLHARGVGKVKRYTSTAQQEALFDAGDTKRQEQALAWAREQGVRYALAGTVDEWRYKVGVDGNRPLASHCKSLTCKAATFSGAAQAASPAGAVKRCRPWHRS